MSYVPGLKPVVLTALASPTSVGLEWVSQGGPKPLAYEIRRDGVVLASVANSVRTYTDSNVMVGTTYAYRIRSAGPRDSVYSNTETVTIAYQVVAAPVLSATAGAAQVSLAWTAVASADSYELQRKTGAGAYVEISDANILTYLNTGLVNGTVYTYRVRGTANSAADVGPWSNEVARTPTSTVPVAPTLTGTAGDSENTLDWNTVANATTYRLRRTVGGVTINFPDQAASDYIDDTVTNDTTYQYAVRGITSDGVLGSLSAPLDLRPSAAAPPPAGVDFLIIDKAVLLTRSTANASYTAMKAVADSALGTVDLWNQDSIVAGKTFAAALVYARTGTASYKAKVDAVLAQLPNFTSTSASNGELAASRQLAGFVIAADLVGYRPSTFVNWVSGTRTRSLGTHPRWQQITAVSNDTCGNWGAWAMASRIAMSLFVGDSADVAAAYTVIRAHLGDHTAYSGYRPTSATSGGYDTTWDCDPYPANTLVGINRDCGDRNGAVIEDISRSAGSYSTIDASGLMYSWENLGGLIMSMRLLKHNGYPNVYTLSSNALRRAAEFLDRKGSYPPPYSVTQHIPFEINAVYSIALGPTAAAAGYGRQFGFTDWLNGN